MGYFLLVHFILQSTIMIRLDKVLADRKMQLNELAKKMDMSNVNLSLIKTGKIKAVRLNTLNALCEILHCEPGDLLEYVPDNEEKVEGK